MSKLKVYGWTGVNGGLGSRQSRNIIAAATIAEARAGAGISSFFYDLDGSITTSPDEVTAAMAKPGVMLSRPLDDPAARWREARWRAHHREWVDAESGLWVSDAGYEVCQDHRGPRAECTLPHRTRRQ